ncbi:hypothetical protein N8222_08235 [Oceanospirillaceae bacterium]|nr:hypothetical protein [Oceanospirillaceae bacterium]
MIQTGNIGYIKQQALKHLQAMTNNPSAMFHDGQLEAILELVANYKQILVVQKTGWGKSAVYFIAYLRSPQANRPTRSGPRRRTNEPSSITRRF